MRSPACKTRISPGTTVSASTETALPSRNTAACGAESFRSASSAFCARVSCTVPITALSTTIPRMTSASARPSSPCMRAVTNETAAAASRMTIIKSANCPKNRRRVPGGFCVCSAFLPYVFCRCSASSAASPVCALTFSSVSVCADVLLCQFILYSSVRPMYIPRGEETCLQAYLYAHARIVTRGDGYDDCRADGGL